jgi:hypothetical protein
VSSLAVLKFCLFNFNSYSDVQKSVPVKLARLLLCISISCCLDSHPRIDSVLQKYGFRYGLLENAIIASLSVLLMHICPHVLSLRRVVDGKQLGEGYNSLYSQDLWVVAGFDL